MKEFWEQVYESMACHVVETAKIPGVEDAFADRAYCMQQYCFAITKGRALPVPY